MRIWNKPDELAVNGFNRPADIRAKSLRVPREVVSFICSFSQGGAKVRVKTSPRTLPSSNPTKIANAARIIFFLREIIFALQNGELARNDPWLFYNQCA
jgi:hypothetical protein